MVPPQVVAHLASAADAAIGPILRAGGVPGQGVPNNEIDFVAAAVLGGVPAVASAWQPILAQHGIQLSITGVFCHGSPMVEFTDAANSVRRCELGDLLIVVDEITGRVISDRRAVLVQAKMASSSGAVAIQGTARVQLELYRTWPIFRFIPAQYAPKLRDFHACAFSGKTVDDGRYGVIDKHGKPPDWYQVAPGSSPMSTAGTPLLGSYMAKMSEPPPPSAGRNAIAGGADDWSFTLDELLSITAARTFGLVTVGGRRFARGRTALTSIHPLHGDTSADFGWMIIAGDPPSGSGETRPPSEAPREGISTIRIVLSHSGRD